MKEVILYGGAFNPPTVAHQAVLQACVNRAESNGAQVWVMPSGDREDKVIAASLQRRIQLSEALLESVCNPGNIELRIEPYELESDSPTETFETQKALTDAYPQYEFTWVFGADSVATMPEWRGGNWLYKNIGMLVIPRVGYQLPTLPPRATVLPVETIPTSSTAVRELMDRGEDVSHLVPRAVQRVLAAG